MCVVYVFFSQEDEFANIVVSFEKGALVGAEPWDRWEVEDEEEGGRGSGGAL